MIEICHLKKQYNGVTVLKDINAVVNKGDVISVIGPSGTGKSTLLRCINLLEKPNDGKIMLDGEDITDKHCKINRVRLKIGMVFQSFNLYEHLTVVENCMLAQKVLLKRKPQEAYDKAMKLLSSVGMEQHALKYPCQLSGGQKQRVAIARTLATDPEIILFDEPTSALDPLTVGEVEQVISSLAQQGHTMMIVTHSMEFARSVSNRVFYMDQGEIYEEGTPEQIFDNPQKERTKKFIKRLSCLTMTVTEDKHDLYAEIGKIYSFCSEKNLDLHRITNACNSYEEAYNLFSRYVLQEDKTIYVSLEYDVDNDILSCSFTPFSSVDTSTNRDVILGSPEYKLICHYSKKKRIEQSDEGIGLRYTIEL